MLLCHNCQIAKPEDCFYKQKNTKRGYRKQCKECMSLMGNQYYNNNKENKKRYAIIHKDDISIRQKKWREKNKDYIIEHQREYREENKEKLKELNKKYREKNKEDIQRYQKQYRKDHLEESREYRKQYNEVNKEHISTRGKKYREEHRQSLNEWRREYYQTHLKNDLDYKVKANLRRRLNAVLRGQEKHKRTLELLGCSLEDFKSYIESRFTEGMTWDNYGINGWHIDHIKPLAHFDLKDPKQLEEATHYTNMQPLWEKDNCSKSDRYIG